MDKHSTDILVLGAGCAGLQLVYQLVTHPKYQQQKIILLDHQPWGSAQKTWCFWRSANEVIYPEIHSATWKDVEVILPDKSAVTSTLGAYQYTQITSQDFFSFHDQFFQNYPITFLQTKVKEITAQGVLTSDGKIQAKHIFSSLSLNDVKDHDLHLKQHFFGWQIKTTAPRFNPDCLTLMDLSVPQPLDGMAFMYILPYSTTQALVEFTVFSPQTWAEETYTKQLRLYLEGINGWEITGSEKGVIPMYGGQFPEKSTAGVHWIGGAGGQIKPSTGYAFYRIWQDSRRIVASYYGQKKSNQKKSRRFRAYDLWLLHILQYKPTSSTRIFDALFSKVPLERTFKFLNEQTSLWEEVLLFSKLPKRLFLRAVWDRLPNIIS